MSTILVYAKAVVAAVAAAVIGALAGIDWVAVILSALASGGLTGAVPNKKHKR